LTDTQAIEKLLPDAKFAQDAESGEVGLAVDGAPSLPSSSPFMTLM